MRISDWSSDVCSSDLSNGRSGAGSRSLNTLYVQPVASVALGSYRLSVGPRLWLYAGSLSDNPDIKRYRGNTGLFAEIGEDDGLRITTNTRLNFGSGKGAIDARSEERREGKECGSPCRSRWSPYK